MHKSLRSLISLGAFLTCAAFLHAQPALKVVVIDMVKIYDTFYKTEEANAKLNDAAQRAQEELDKLQKQLQVTADEYKQLVEDSRSSIKNEQARAKAEADANIKRAEFERLQNDAQAFRVNTQRSLQQRAKNHRDILMDEILKVVNDFARAKGATLVLDKSGPSGLGVPVILFSDPAYDITEDVVREVNKDRPASAAQSPAAAKPAATPATPASNPTGFTVPNVTEPKKN